MYNSSEKRSAAIRDLQVRDAKAREQTAEKEQKLREIRDRQQALLSTWESTTIAAIAHTIREVNRDLGNQESPLFYVPLPSPVTTIGAPPIFFGLKERSGHQPEAILEFRMNEHGEVSAHINIVKAALPSPVLLENINTDWIEDVADTALLILAKTPKKIQ